MPSQSAQNLRKSHALGKEKKEARINGNSQKALSNGSAKKLPKREQIPSDESEYDSAEDTKLLAQLDTSVGFGSDEVSGDDDQMTLNEEQLNGLVQSDESDESELNNGQEVDDQEDGAQENGNDVSGASDEDDADEVPQATTDIPVTFTGAGELASEEEIVSKDVAEFVTLLKDFKEKIVELRSRLAPSLERVRKGEVRTSNGVSLLEVKVHSMLSYLTNLAFYLLLKVHGQSISGHPVVDQLVELRIVLEKIKPLEQKLKYQIDKLVKAASMHEDQRDATGADGESLGTALQDPLKFRPNPAAMLAQEGEDAQGKAADGEEKTGIYRPPKLVPMPYNEDGRSKSGKLSQQAKEKASRSRLLRDLRAQYDERPEEMTAEGTGYGAQEVGASKEDEKWVERERFEEENFVRLNMTREDKKLANQLRKKGALLRFQDEFQALEDDFRDLSSVQRAVQDEDEINYGKGVMQRKNRRAAEIAAGEHNSKKRKFTDVGDMISSFANVTRTRGGADDFGKEVKKRKKALVKKGKGRSKR